MTILNVRGLYYSWEDGMIDYLQELGNVFVPRFFFGFSLYGLPSIPGKVLIE
jgi:hypothetical protein